MNSHPPVYGKLRAGTLCRVRYRDASFSYQHILRLSRITPAAVTTYGRLRRFEKDFIDISIVWEADTGRVSRGIVIPRPSIMSIVVFDSI